MLVCNTCKQALSACSCNSEQLNQSDPWIGKSINEQYEIVRLIAQGGMGAVYEARHLHLGLSRAIKMIRSDKKIDEVVFQRFKKEAQAVSGLSHRNIVAFYDYGIWESSPYVIMDLLSGSSLSEHLHRKGRLNIHEALEIFIQVADAISYAHSKGITHRDLKPGNIMLLPAESADSEAVQAKAEHSGHDTGSSFMVKVMDFGIAKIRGDEEFQKLTSTGEIFGSPAYMSPEQARGVPVDERSDIYSLGCVIFETLNGSPPFIGSNPLETLMKHQAEKVPSFKSDERKFDLLLHDMEAIVARCLEKEPSKRYAVMTDLLDDLKKLSYGERLLHLQREMGARRRMQVISKIYKYLLIAFALSIVPYAVCTVMLDSSSWDRQLRSAMDDPDHAAKIIQQIIADLPRSDPAFRRNRAVLLFNQAQFLRMKAQSKRDFQRAAQKYKEALSDLEAAQVFKRESFFGAYQDLATQTWDGLALACLQDPQPGESELQTAEEVNAKAIAMRHKAIKLSGKMNAENAKALAKSLLISARLSQLKGDYATGLSALAEAEKNLRAYVPASWILAECLKKEAELLTLTGSKQAAAVKYVQAAKIAQTIYDADDPELQFLRSRAKELSQ